MRDALGFAVIGEERGGETSAEGSPYCVNLALVEGDQVIVAVVDDPSTREADVAERDRGAWVLQGGVRRRLITSDKSRTIVIEDSHAKGARREHAARFTAGAVRADRWDLRALGTTLSLSYAAAGRIAAYVLFWTSAVDAGAGSLLVTEAGGTQPDIDGRPWTIRSDSIIVSVNPDLHQEMSILPAQPRPIRRSALEHAT